MSAMNKISVSAPDTAPPVSQASIDTALAIYGIELPHESAYPILDLSLTDRGVTTRRPLSNSVEIKIGPAAFSSWGLLGSTLAHEIEVHARQNFFLIYMMDIVGLDGTGEAERQAYLHELRNAKRFGLIRDDSELIRQTMAYFYPTPRHLAGRMTGKVRQWFAKNIVRQ
jgi:hypothetical protein